MDLHNFSGEKMYFDEALSPSVEELIELASSLYGEGDAELPLLKAYFLESRSLSVIVALYRFYYYQHRYEDALRCADQALALVGTKLGFPADWRKVNLDMLGYAVMTSMTLLRFYLMALKGSGYLHLRMENLEEGAQRLEKVVELDSNDRLGAAYLLDTVNRYKRRKNANFGKLTVVA